MPERKFSLEEVQEKIGKGEGERMRKQIGIEQKLAQELDEIGFANKIKTRPKIIEYLIEQYNNQRGEQ